MHKHDTLYTINLQLISFTYKLQVEVGSLIVLQRPVADSEHMHEAKNNNQKEQR